MLSSHELALPFAVLLAGNLCLMRMAIASINLEFLIHGSAQPIMGQHALNRMLNHPGGMLASIIFESRSFSQAAGIPRMPIIDSSALAFFPVTLTLAALSIIT